MLPKAQLRQPHPQQLQQPLQLHLLLPLTVRAEREMWPRLQAQQPLQLHLLLPLMVRVEKKRQIQRPQQRLKAELPRLERIREPRPEGKDVPENSLHKRGNDK
jgi:hypothetical protein